MTDTPEAVRLADELDKWARNYASTTYEDDMATKSAALLRRVPAIEAESAEWRKQADTLTHQVICCGVAASHPDPELTKHGAYAGKWNSAQAEEVRKLRAERDQLKKQAASVRSHLTDALAFLLCEKDGNDDPHHLIWEGGAIPEPWGEVWQKYLPDAESLAGSAFKSVIDWGLAFDEAEAQALDDAIAERDQLRAELEKVRWQPIETAPKDGTNIWVYNGEQGVMHWIDVDVVALFVWEDDLLSDADPEPVQPTHWMPLPATPTPPNADQKGTA